MSYLLFAVSLFCFVGNLVCMVIDTWHEKFMHAVSDAIISTCFFTYVCLIPITAIPNSVSIGIIIALTIAFFIRALLYLKEKFYKTALFYSIAFSSLSILLMTISIFALTNAINC